MPQVSTVLLTAKGEYRKANLQLTEDNNILNIETIQKYFKKKETPERICYYEYDNKIIFIFGYKNGKKDKESKIILPTPYNNITLFGDALVVVSLNNKWENPIPYTVEQWNKFYEVSTNSKKNKVINSLEDDLDSDSETNTDNEDEVDIMSEISSEKSVKDDYDDSESELSIPDDNESDKEDDLEPEPIIIKKKKTPVFNKVDNSLYNEHISKNSEAESHKLRELCLKSLNFLKEDFSDEEIRKLENSIFLSTFENAEKHYIPKNWKSHQFTELYRQLVRSVLSNLHPDSPVKNPRLLNRIKDGEFSLDCIASMSSYEMYPEKWFSLRDKQLQREQKILEGNKSRATDQFKCRRCNKRECTYYELQTRSADEPMTIFITCLNCGKEWRQGG